LPMNQNSRDMKDVIIETLRKHPEGLTLKDISDLVGHHRHTITKYVYELIGAQVIIQRDIGAAKLCYLKSCYKGSSLKSQAQLLTILFFLLLLPTAIIVAQNATVTTDSVAGMITAIETNEAIDTNMPGDFVNNFSDEIVENTNTGEITPDSLIASNNETDDVAAEENQNSDEVTPSEENSTYEMENDTSFIQEQINENLTEQTNDINVTATLFPEENATGEVAEDEPVQPAEPEIIIQIISPEKVTRGEPVVLRAEINNSGADARQVVLEWILPEYFVITEGSGTENIGDLAAGSSFTSEIAVLSTEDAALGPGEIRVRVSYV